MSRRSSQVVVQVRAETASLKEAEAKAFAERQRQEEAP